MNHYFKFEPVTELASAQVLATSVLLAVAYFQELDAQAIGLATGVIVALFALIATFVRQAVTPNATLEQLKDLTPAEEHAFKVIDSLDERC